MKYILVDKIGEGGYSTVHRCVDNIGIRYACKVLPRPKNKRDRVRSEIDAMKKLGHSIRTPRYIDALEDENNFYIIQEWCRGGTIKDYLGNRDSYAENTVASILRGTLRSLHHIHSAGLLHRDIKAGNILFSDKDEDAIVKICDLGLAHPYETDMIDTTNLVGTPLYMSPEALGKRFGPKSDIWSIGVMAYHLLVGSFPFNDKQNPYEPSLAKIWYSIFNEEPSFQSTLWKEISDDAKHFVKVCLDKSYEERPSVIDALNHPWLTKTDCSERFTGIPLRSEPFKQSGCDDMNTMTINTCNYEELV